MSAEQTTVLIEGRLFRFSALYRPKQPKAGGRPRRLVGWSDIPGLLITASSTSKSTRVFHPRAWADWAGEEVAEP